ncbi:hypothetical protein PSQ19_03075 [Devosia algicola]|uniref:Phosphoglycolate phosphatase n=1 Tax=Devosia algicola TaxID=3026418 RepID=A0ABY7YPE7_9HYPH|nr:hypothetical protein [Devosia algicola]WDR03186.1 hypothetical protein PSQ19_03075 [Devosia algicola]
MTLIVFDMDGTLIDSQGLISEHMAATFTAIGLARQLRRSLAAL